MLPFFIHFC